MSYSTQPL